MCGYTHCVPAPPKPNKRPLPALSPSGAIMVTTRTISIQMPICFFSDAHGPIHKVQVIVAENGGISPSMSMFPEVKISVVKVEIQTKIYLKFFLSGPEFFTSAMLFHDLS